HCRPLSNRPRNPRHPVWARLLLSLIKCSDTWEWRNLTPKLAELVRLGKGTNRGDVRGSRALARPPLSARGCVAAARHRGRTHSGRKPTRAARAKSEIAASPPGTGGPLHRPPTVDKSHKRRL